MMKATARRQSGILFLSALLLSLTAPSLGGQLHDITYESLPDRIRFCISLNKPSQYEIKDALRDSGYFYIDLLNMDYHCQEQTFELHDARVKSVRVVSYPQSHIVRLIFYLYSPAQYEVRLTETPPALTVDIVGQSGSARLTPKKVVIIDPGHGGDSKGARSSRKVKGRYIWEKDVNLVIAKVLKEVIDSSPNMTAFLTRTRDKDMTLTERIAFAEHHRGDVFISIHCNATRGYEASRAQGIELFYWNEKGSDNAAVKYLEELENEGQLNINGSKQNATLFKNLLKDKLEVEKNKSIEVCDNINTALKDITYFRKYNRGIKSARFRILVNYYMPALLIECGFINNAKELKHLLDRKFHVDLARSIFNGLSLYFAQKDMNFTLYQYAM